MILLPIIIIPTVLRLLLHSIKLIALKIELVFLSSSEDKLVQHWTLNHWNWSTIRPPVQLSFCLWRSISTIYNNYHSKQPENKNKTNKWSANYKKKKNKTQATIKSSLYGLFSSLFLLLLYFFAAAEARVSSDWDKEKDIGREKTGSRVWQPTRTADHQEQQQQHRAMISSQVRPSGVSA